MYSLKGCKKTVNRKSGNCQNIKLCSNEIILPYIIFY